jgi:hypothetical protein
MAARKIEVSCYAGYKGEERPISFLLEGERIEVASLEREWGEESPENRTRRRLFMVKGSDGFTYTLCHDDSASSWFLTER